MASRDLQIVRARNSRGVELSSSGADSGNSAGQGNNLLMGIVRRQWWLVLFAVAVSGVGAYVVSGRLEKVMVTAHMSLRSQQIPGTGSGGVYSVPNPAAAAGIIQSSQFMSQTATSQGIELEELLKNLRVHPSQSAPTVSLSMTSPSAGLSISTLQQIADSFAAALKTNREQLLQQQFEYLTNQKATALNELLLARERLAAIQDREAAGEGNSLNDAEIESLVNQQIEIKKEMEIAQRVVARHRRDIRFVLSEADETLEAVLDDLVKARMRSVSDIGKGLTGSTRASAVKETLDGEIVKLEAEIEAFLAGDHSVLPDKSTKSSGNSSLSDEPEGADAKVSQENLVKDASASSPVQEEMKEETAANAPAGSSSDVPPGTATPDTEAQGDAIEQLMAIEQHLVAWRTRIEAVGKDSLGLFDERSEARFSAAIAALEEFQRQVRVKEWEIKELEQQLEDQSVQLQAVVEDINRKGLLLQTTSSNQRLQAEADLEEQGGRYARLISQLDQIQQVKDCPIPEYVVGSAPAVISEADIVSNRKKLFAFIMFGGMVVLCMPSALVELLRLKPSPVSVISRRWNLPVLGIQSSNLSARMPKNERIALARHELRLMALRIQQSLFDPKRRVVMFAGLDHEESPIGLIKALAKCFVQREETVLIIQAVPCQAEVVGKSSVSASGQKTKRPGVAEFLAGEVDDANQLVVSSGISGIDFLPGGCSVNASEAMASSRLTQLIDQFRDRYSMILMSGPSTLHPADLQMLAARADGIVFTVNRNSLNSVYGEEVITDLIELGAPILGFAEQPRQGKKSIPMEKDPADLSKSGAVITLPV